MGRIVTCCLALVYLFLSGPMPLRFEDLSPSLKRFVPAIHSAAEFDHLRQELAAESEERLRQGERDALLYYVLQARRFTLRPPIDPARAAHHYTENSPLSPEVKARFSDFITACHNSDRNARLSYFCEISHNGENLASAYPQAIRFIQAKEFDSKSSEGSKRRAFIASLYQTRGLSTDSSFDANFPIFLALRSLAANPGLHLDRVLIVGPGLDFAPRTQLDDSIPPQSIQPFAVADALLQLGISTPDRLRIHCVDINPRVIEYFRSRVPRSLSIQARTGTDEYGNYFRNFGLAIGKVHMEGSTKIVDVSPRYSSSIAADRLNILTEHLGTASYDLVIATNVLVYQSKQQLALTFANIASMLREGGYFIHNELRDEVEAIGGAAGLPVINARMIRVREDDARAIFDGQVTHQKAPNGRTE
jgi:hypothetical protein